MKNMTDRTETLNMDSIVNASGRRYKIIQYNEMTYEAVLIGDMNGEFRTSLTPEKMKQYGYRFEKSGDTNNAGVI
jgi:hypothetical protein